MISLDGVVSVLGANMHIAQMYSPTWTSACARHNCVDGGGVGFGVDSKRLQKAKVSVLIVCSSCNVSLLQPMYRCKRAWVSWWPFSTPCGGKDKH
jgi:hypothetical protein